MPKNLESKIGNLLDDLETLDRGEKVRRVKQLVEQEVRFMEAKHELTDWDLTFINSTAVDNMGKISLGSSSKFSTDSSKLRTWCFTQAVLSWMRKEKLVNFLLNYDDKK